MACFPRTSCLNGQKLELVAYTDTEEDYQASLYYDVEGVAATYFNGSSTALTAVDTGAKNPNATGSYVPAAPSIPAGFTGSSYPGGIYAAYTAHFVDCFYVVNLGYYDPFDLSANGEPNGDYGSGWWYSVDAYGTYIAEASILIGQTGDAQNEYSGDYKGGSIETILYQDFIPPDNIPGPTSINCLSNVYAGDDRTTATGAPAFSPFLGSFRAMQQVSVGVGGYTGITTANAPPLQATGWTYQFSSRVLQGGRIPQTAYNFDYLGKCVSAGVNDYGHASTAKMTVTTSYNGVSSTQVALNGSASNPVPLWSFAIDWKANLTLSEPGGTTLNISGTYSSDCYPAHEVSVGAHDIVQWAPTSENGAYIAGCLAGGSPYTKTINQSTPLTTYNGPAFPPGPTPLL